MSLDVNNTCMPGPCPRGQRLNSMYAYLPPIVCKYFDTDQQRVINVNLFESKCSCV